MRLDVGGNDGARLGGGAAGKRNGGLVGIGGLEAGGLAAVEVGVQHNRIHVDKEEVVVGEVVVVNHGVAAEQQSDRRSVGRGSGDDRRHGESPAEPAGVNAVGHILHTEGNRINHRQVRDSALGHFDGQSVGNRFTDLHIAVGRVRRTVALAGRIQHLGDGEARNLESGRGIR